MTHIQLVFFREFHRRVMRMVRFGFRAVIASVCLGLAGLAAYSFLPVLQVR